MNSKRIDSNQGRRTPNHWQKTPLTWMRLAPPYSPCWWAGEDQRISTLIWNHPSNQSMPRSKHRSNHSTIQPFNRTLFSTFRLIYKILHQLKRPPSWEGQRICMDLPGQRVCRIFSINISIPFSKALGVFAVQDGVFVTLDIAARRFALPRCLDAEGGGRWLVWRIDKLLYSDEIDVRGRYTYLIAYRMYRGRYTSSWIHILCMYCLQFSLYYLSIWFILH